MIMPLLTTISDEDDMKDDNDECNKYRSGNSGVGGSNCGSSLFDGYFREDVD